MASDPAQFESPLLWGPLERGQYGIGFTTRLVVDSNRHVLPDTTELYGRPIRLMIWYPARPATGTPLRFGDYFPEVDMEGSSRPYISALDVRDRDVARRQFAPPSDSLRAVLFEVVVPAHKDATPSRGRAPLVVYAGGRNNYQQESTVLWEYLASHGYVVAVVPQFGRTFADARLDFDLPDMEVLKQDILHAIDAAGDLPFADRERVAVVGHSSGSVAGLMAAASDSRIDVLVGLDDAGMTAEGVELLGAAGFGRPAGSEVTMPIIEIYAHGKQGYSSDVVETLTSTDRHLVGLGTGTPPALATHFDFQAWPVYPEVFGLSDERAAGARPIAMGAGFYWSAVRLTRALLDAAFSGRTDNPVDVHDIVIPGVEVHYQHLPTRRVN